MSAPPDPWYVRLPDGRVLRAASTHVLRQHLSTGRIPADSRVRRSPEEEWTNLDWSEEFSDLIQKAPAPKTTDTLVVPEEEEPESPFATLPARVAPRYDSARLHTVGLGGLAEELLAALDNTLGRPKLVVAGITGVLCGLVVAVAGTLHAPEAWLFSAYLPWVIAGAVVFLLGVVSNILLTQLTYMELSRLRPASLREARVGMVGFSVRLMVAYLVAGGGAVALILCLRWLPSWLVQWHEAGRLPWMKDYWPGIVAVLGLFVEVILWPVVGFTLLLGPVVVVEESPVFTALAQWWWLVRRHLGRLFLYESAAALVGLATLVFAFPLVLAAWGRWGHWDSFDTPIGFAFCLLTGLAAAPLIAYVAVAHVFIYLNLRYEYDQRNPPR